MPPKSAPFQIARSDNAIYVRVEGLGSMNNASALDAFAEREIEDGAEQFILDLSDCTGVDSTFMGTLLGLSNRVRDLSETAGVVLINVDDHAYKQLSGVGVDAFVTLVQGKSKLPSKLRLTQLSTEPVSDRERLKLMVRAHKDLVAADSRNEAKFGAFLSAIVAELE
ncbi:MAG: STAS domain-containing protein [Planctomycetes bacterium]|nr:STAS domain-containing protein [Planctomycetota bacterium]